MALLRKTPLHTRLAQLDELIAQLRTRSRREIVATIDRWRLDAAAARFHLERDNPRPILLAILGGTGTGKSTLLNRLLDAQVTAASFRRTFTAGAVAVAHDPSTIPTDWLGIDLLPATQLPVRGQPDALTVVAVDHPLTQRLTLIDTPDLDGDQPAHHAQADRVFRWADAILFLVTPEKYQMTELLPYYRLASRYALPAMYVMNKVETQAVVDDYRAQLASRDGDAVVFAIPRDDAAYEPPPRENLCALRETLTTLESPAKEHRQRGAFARIADQLDRLRDQVLQPLREDRRGVDAMIASLRALESPLPGVDVHPLTHQLQRRLQQRSVLYLMGPGRMLDRVRQVPGLLARLPRTVWDLYRHGQLRRGGEELPPDISQEVPDFQAALVDQFRIVQSRIDDVLRSSSLGPRLIESDAEAFAASRIDPAAAGAIAEQELAELKAWLETRWNATPRDTAVLTKLLRLLPGGEKLTKWSEAAPYLLAVVVAAQNAFFGPIDLLVIGGFSLATWIGEKLSNEVAARARLTNSRISQRFTELASEQVRRTCAWLDHSAPAPQQLDALDAAAAEISEAVAESQGE